LIVEDEELDRTILRHQLNRAGLRCEEAASASEALTRLGRAHELDQPFDLAIIDYQMPEMNGIELGRRILAEPAWKNTRLIMVTAFRDRKLRRNVLAAGFHGFLTKPLKESELVDVMRRTLNNPTDNPTNNPADNPGRNPADSLRPAHGPRTPGAGGSQASYRILVAEDNVVNQKLMLKVLAKMGHAADVVTDGRQAVEAALRNKYDVILMDCQMPELDGYEAAAEIRRKEPAGRHVSIVALTANAMKGDSERCLAAGMDDYLPKPVDLALLKQTLLRWAETSMRARETENAGVA
jgi:CheY-like chemotaxis protein